MTTFSQTECWRCSVIADIHRAYVQVVSGTNYGLEFTAYYYCFDSEGEVLTDTQAPLRSVVYVPIQDASLETADQAFDGPVIKDIWFFDTPEVIAYAEGPPEEEAPAPELAPEAEAPAAESGITLLSPGAGSLDSGTTSFTFSPSPAASSSPSARASPTPQVVSGFSVAAQNQSIISG